MITKEIDVNRIGVFEAKTHFSELIDNAIAGKATIITKRGKAVAQIVPMPDARQKRATLAVERLRAMRGALKLAPGESVRDLIYEGRR